MTIRDKQTRSDFLTREYHEVMFCVIFPQPSQQFLIKRCKFIFVLSEKI